VDLVKVDNASQRYLQRILGCEKLGDLFEDFGIRPVRVVKARRVDDRDRVLFVVIKKKLDGLGRRRC
jgi:hypothetical protein